LRFTKTLISTGVAAATLGILATAAPAMADAGPWTPFAIASTVAAGSTGPMMFEFLQSGTTDVQFNHQASDPLNPSTVVLHAPDHTVFPAQTTVTVKASGDNGVTFVTSASLFAIDCVSSDAGTTLTCRLSNPDLTNNHYWPGRIYGFAPQVTVDPSVAPGTPLFGGSATMNMYNYAGAPIGYLTATNAQPLLTIPPAPGQPIYNEDGSVDIPGTGTPGATITVKDASGATIGTATVAADGTYDVKVPAAQGGTVTVTESDVLGTSWPVTIAADLLGTPVVNPFIAGGAALALVAGLGTVVLVRRRKAAVEA
jgi:hypothetical protein